MWSESHPALLVDQRWDIDMRATRSTRRPWTRWTLVAGVVFLGGTVAAFGGASAISRADVLRHDRAFASSAREVAATLDLTLQREADLIVDTAGRLAGEPNLTGASFVEWAASIHALDRYPEVLSLDYLVLVDQDSLARCILRGHVVRTGAVALAQDHNPCAADEDPRIMWARDFGLASYTSPADSPGSTMTVVTPVYRHGTVPTTANERQSEFVGWIQVRIVPDLVLERATTGHKELSVELRYSDGYSVVSIGRSEPAAAARQLSAPIEGGWTVTVHENTTPDDGILSNGKSLGLALGGTLGSALLAVLIIVLGEGRKRAWAAANTTSDELQWQVMHDSLTNLPNRHLIGDRLRQMLLRGRRNGTEGAALYVDVDGFKDVNDALGLAAGDHLLQAVATRLTENLREADTVGRMGGDEFVVLVEGGDDQEAASAVAARVLEAMHEPFDIDEAPSPISVTTSIGVAVGDRDNPADLLRDADVALSQAKVAGKDRFEVFDERSQASIDARQTLQFDLRSALDSNEFQLHYQSVHRLDDLAIIGSEALIRWQHPTRGLIGPDEFIPLLESNGSIVAVGCWVLREACTQTMLWRDLGYDLTVAVNVSARQLDRDSIVDDVRQALQDSGLAPGKLVLEVTETALMRDVDTTARRLHQLRDLGVEIAIDDFGTGYASLTYLHLFPVDWIKIDRSFTAAIGRSSAGDRMVHAMAQLGQNLGLRTVAEGIETAEQLEFVRAEGVEDAQGYFMSRPQPPSEFERHLVRSTSPSHFHWPPSASHGESSKSTNDSREVAVT
ncbi:MAG: diguanylate cyclase/phosphodiesterase [Acidimicrobiales bacterium]|nr:diguanylate cyclase/phosphodiesterase [Acidimicrobiales bacterium]